MGSNKPIDFFPLGPSNSVHIEINRVSPKALIKMLQTVHESLFLFREMNVAAIQQQ
jgi:hypothetical protein